MLGSMKGDGGLRWKKGMRGEVTTRGKMDVAIMVVVATISSTEVHETWRGKKNLE